MVSTVADAVEWLESPSLARRLTWTMAIGIVVVLAVDLALFLRFPNTIGGGLFALLLLGAIWTAALTETPRRVAADGLALRVRYMLGERKIPLSEVLALDLAPGPTRETSTMRVALRHTRRIFGVALERPAADALATRLERLGYFVNRTPPPRVPGPTGA